MSHLKCNNVSEGYDTFIWILIPQLVTTQVFRRCFKDWLAGSAYFIYSCSNKREQSTNKISSCSYKTIWNIDDVHLGCSDM